MSDPRLRIDYILAVGESNEGEIKSLRRENYEANLVAEGLKIEKEDRKVHLSTILETRLSRSN